MTLEELLRQGKSFGQGASNAAASTVTGPVDMLAWLLRKGGVPVGDTPIGGEAWMRQKGLMATPENKLAGLLGEGAGLAAPIVAAAKAPEIAGGLLQMGRNLATPQTMNKQAGMIRTPLGQIPENRGDVNKLSTRLAGLLDDAKIPYSSDKSNISNSRYFEINDPRQLASDLAEYGPEKYKVRISDHINVHGADASVDPHTNQTFEQMLNGLREIGVPVGSKVKPASRAVIDDATLEKILGPLDKMPKEFVESYRNSIRLDKQGRWVRKP